MPYMQRALHKCVLSGTLMTQIKMWEAKELQGGGLGQEKSKWGRDKVGAWDEHTHTTVHKIDKQGPTV